MSAPRDPLLVVKLVGTGLRERRSLDLPAPTLMADILAGVCRRGWQYWIEGGSTLMPAEYVPSDASEVEDHGPLPTQVAPVEKPPYRVPTMAEIRAMPWNGFKVAGTFSGCGGSSLGYRMAGFKVVYANEFVEAARDSYRANMDPETILDDRDIRQVTAESILEMTGLEVGELDLLDGSPPCSDFSTAGKRSAGWGKEKAYCVDPSTLVLMEDMTWKPASDLLEGDRVVGFDENPPTGGRRFRKAVIERVIRLRRPCVEIITSDGARIRCSVEHRWLFTSGANLRWKQARNVKPGDKLLSVGRPWVAAQDYDAGWLAGIFDGEGYVSRQNGGNTRLLGFAQKRGAVLDKACAILGRLGVRFGVYENSAEVCYVNINGGPWGKARLLGMIRPARLLPNADKVWDGGQIGLPTKKIEVLSVTPVGEQDVVGLTTSTKTFIADGFLSHNSDDKKQRVDDLFFEFARLVDGLQPKVFVAENVSGLVKGVAKGYFLEILAALKACGPGYRVSARLIDAQWLGVPQARQRLIFVGVRSDLGLEPVHPTPLPYRYSIRDALPWISGYRFDTGGHHQAQDPDRGADVPAHTISGVRGKNATHHQVEVRQGNGSSHSTARGEQIDLDGPVPAILAGGDGPHGRRDRTDQFEVAVAAGANAGFGTEQWQSLDEPAKTIGASPTTGNGRAGAGDLLVMKIGKNDAVPENVGASLEGYAVGDEWDRLTPGKKSDRYLNLVRPDADAPCPTVTASGGGGGNAGVPGSVASVTHPTEKRKFSIAELRRLGGFPDDFVLTGSYGQQWERIGRAVPPVMMSHVAATIRDRVLIPARSGRP